MLSMAKTSWPGPFQINITTTPKPHVTFGQLREGWPDSERYLDIKSYERIPKCNCYATKVTVERNADSQYYVSTNNEEPVAYEGFSVDNELFYVAIRDDAIAAVAQWAQINGALHPIDRMQTRGLHAPECDMNDLVEYIHGTQNNQKEKFQLGPTPPNWRLYGIDKTQELLGNITLHICLRQIQPHNQEPFWVIHDSPPFTVRADRDFLFGVQIRRRERDLRFISRNKGVDTVHFTSRLRPESSEKGYSACFHVAVREKYGHYSVEFDHEGATKTIENIKGPIDRQFISLQGKFEAGKTKANITMDILNNQGHIDHTQDFEAKDLS
ncbi:unnamed protein product, partial [Mesorhabditis spiculigera]